MNKDAGILFALICLIFPLTISLQAQETDPKYFFETIATQLNFPEGPAWNGTGTLYASNCYGDWITKVEDNRPGVFIKAPSYPVAFSKTNGLTVYKDGSIYACDYGLGAILKFSPDGECTQISGGFNGEKFNRPNDLAFDGKGNLYFTDPKSYDSLKLDGVIYRLTLEDNIVVPVAKDLAFPNGIALDPSGKEIYICESAKQRILKFDINEHGVLVNQSVFIELPGGDPDGIAFDVNGALYAAHFGSGNIYKISPAGKILEEIKTPGKKPSNVEFGGEDMRTLYITETETNAIYSLRVDVPGLKLFSSPGIDQPK